MTSMPHLPEMAWDFKDQLQMVDKGGGCMVYYVYDAGGQRVRKVIEQNGRRQKERFYLGGFEVYRRYNGGESSPKLERETLHLMDDQQRIAMVETQTQGDETGLPAQLIRYQLGNHLNSVSLELDAAAQIISYEEYYPYGSTSYQAVSSQTETPKRYRYTRMERDEETGLHYHGARYYMDWLGRWVSCDPDEALYTNWSSYSYAFLNPLRFSDPTGRNPVLTQTVRVEDTTRQLRSLGERISGLEESMGLVSSQMRDAAAAANYDLVENIRQQHQALARQRASTIRSLRRSAKEAAGVIQDAQRAIESAPSSGTLRTGAPSPNQVQDLSRRVDDLMEQLTDRSHGLSRHIPRSTRRAVVQASGAVLTATGNFFSRFGWPSSGTGGALPPAAPPTSGPSPSSTARSAAGTAGDLADDVVEETTSRGSLATRVVRGTGRVARHVPRFIPYVGAGAGAASAANEFSQGNYGRGTLDLIGMIPWVGDAVDLARSAGGRIMRRHHIRMQRVRRGQTPNIAPGLLGEIMSWAQ
jgi:RHS repeat-associated protein